MKLEPNHEIVGVISNIHDENNGYTRITFSLLKEIELPKEAIPKEKLKSLIGKRIGLLNLSGDYRIRKIKKGGADGRKKTTR